MLILASACESASFLATVLFIKKLVKVLSYIVPAILILLVSIDFAKAVIASNDDDIKRAQKLAIKRIIAGLIVFFIPLLVEASFNMLGNNGKTWLACYNNSTDAVVNALVKAENAKLIKNEKDRQEMIKAAKKSKEAERKKIDELREKARQNGGNSAANATAEKIAATAETAAWPLGTPKSKYARESGGTPYGEFESIHKKYYPNESIRKTACCCHSARTILSGATGKKIGNLLPNTESASAARNELVSSVSGTGLQVIAWDGNSKSLKRGDVCSFAWKRGGGHVFIYLGDGKIAEGNYSSKNYSHIIKDSYSGNSQYWYFYIIRYPN